MMPKMFRLCCGLTLALTILAPGRPRAQSTPGGLHAPLDKILDTYVRDGFAYYLALQKDRGALDRYVASLDIPRARIEDWSKPDQEAFWLNAYDAIVLRTVIDAYPIKSRSSEYPAKSIRQIPGAFEQVKHRVGGQVLTLDQIEKDILVKFGDARLVLALGRGAVGSGRLRSEAFQGAALDQQLALVLNECASRVSCVKVDRDKNVLQVTPLVSWREDVFVQSFAEAGQAMWPNRTPIERAVAAMMFSHMFPSERDFLKANTFQMKYGDFDWRLNDLTGGLPN
jgi:hypothetical protein